MIAGYVGNVTTSPMGSVLVSWEGNVLTVSDASDFPPAGKFTVGDSPTEYTFTGIIYGEDESDVLQTLETAPAGVAPDDDVLVAPRALQKLADVFLPEGGDAIPCVVPHSLHALLEDGVREEEATAESVEIEEINGVWYIKNIIGEVANIGSRYIEGLDEALSALGVELEEAAVALEEAKQELAQADSVLASDLNRISGELSQAKTDLAKADENFTKAVADAANAASTAQSTADTAQSTAQIAQTAAEAATSAATKASQDAATANNQAVAAWDKALASATSGGNLILNGSFEQLDSKGNPVEWDAPNTTRRFYTTEKARTGTRSQKTVISGSGSYGTYHPTRFAVRPGRSYYVEGWVLRPASTTTTANVGFIWQCFDNAGANISSAGTYVTQGAQTLPADTWVKLSRTITVTADAAVTGRFGIYTAAGVEGEAIFFDDVLVVDVTDAVAAQKAADAAGTAAANAQKTADSALTSANGKNTIIRSTSAASGSGTREGDIWWQVDSLAANNVISQWTWDGNAWVRSMIKSEVVANLDVNKLTAGTAAMQLATAQRMVGDFGTFRLLTADKVVLGSSTNLIPNGGLEHGDARGWPAAITYQKTDVAPGMNAAVSYSGGTLNGPVGDIPVTPGTELLFEVWLKASVAGSRIYIEVRDDTGVHLATTGSVDTAWRDLKTGAFSGQYPINAQAVPTEWTKYQRIIKVRDGVRSIKIGGIYFNHSSGTVTNATQSISGLRIVPRMTGELIVDGSITANKITADQAFATKLAAILASFQSVFADKITAEMIVSNEVLAQKVSALFGSFQAIFTDKITAQMLNADEVLAQKVSSMMATFQSVFANSITANMIQADALNGKTIQGVDIYSPDATSVPRIHLGGSVLEVIRSDGESEFTTVTVGGTTADRMQIMDSTGTIVGGFDETGSAVAQNLDVSSSLTYRGEELVDLLAQLPRGLVARQSLGSSSSVGNLRFGSTELGLVEIMFSAAPGRMFKVRYRGLAVLTGAGVHTFRLRATSSAGYDGFVTAPTLANSIQYQQNNYTTGGTGSASEYVTVDIEALIGDYNGQYRFLLTGQSSDGGNGRLVVSDTLRGEFTVEDVGTYLSRGDGGLNTGGGTPYTGSPTVTPSPTVPPPKTYTSTWTASWFKSWRSGSEVTDYLQQGYYGGAQRYTMIGWTGPNSTGGETGRTVVQALAGATVSKVEVYLENASWYYGAGGQALIGKHGAQTAPASPQTSGGTPFSSGTWARGAAKWVTLPSSWYAGIASGAVDGITLGEGAGSNMTYYGKFKRLAASCRLRITYTK